MDLYLSMLPSTTCLESITDSTVGFGTVSQKKNSTYPLWHSAISVLQLLPHSWKVL
uniref:Uncharacterized protein n=1 Tax=Picea glauca TaxID=3330 RepID=A0A101LZ23_PICGL|nr:hypothetical protein ABT39_MTgene4892 [Picea glauca]QHR92345.1 hypothetical protein Q903MT_gene6387 [Picea sitchensis]